MSCSLCTECSDTISFSRFPAGAPRERIWRALLWVLYLCAAVIATFTLWGKWLKYAVGLRAATAWVASPPYLLRQPLSAVTFGIAMLGAIAVAILQIPRARRCGSAPPLPMGGLGWRCGSGAGGAVGCD